MSETEQHRIRRALEGERPGLRSRVFPLDDISIRAGGDGRTVTAYAAVFDSPAEIADQDGHYSEQISRTAFDKTIRERAGRIGVFYNHSRTMLGTPSDRGSVPIGTPLEIRPDGRGLLTVTRYNKTPLADDVLESIRNGDITGQSFTGAFVQSDPPPPYHSRGGRLTRVTRKEIALLEYGPTPIPAYADAEILGVRAAQEREAARAADGGTVTRPEGAEPYRRRPGENVQCPDCGGYNEADANYCDQCGAQLPDSAFPDGREPYQRDAGETVQCPSCDRWNEPDAVFCDQCGAQLPELAYDDATANNGSGGAGGAVSGSGRASMARHEPVNGTHSHPHPAYGSQGGDATHSHEHAHHGDANHQHSHAGPDDAAGDGTGRSADPDVLLAAHFGWTRDQAAELPEAERSLLLASIRHVHGDVRERADVDNSAWDGNAAMSACSSAADYRAICAGEHTTGDPDQRQHWALPHHKTAGAPPNANGVRNSLSRLPTTEDLKNKQAAEAHLRAHMRAVSPGGDSGSGNQDGGGESRSQRPDAPVRVTRVIPGTSTAEGPREHPEASETSSETETGPRHPHPGHEERNTTVDTTMTVDQRAARQNEIRERMSAIDAEHPGTALPEDLQAEWDQLDAEYGEHDRAIAEHTQAIEARRSRLAALAAGQEGERAGSGETGYDPEQEAAPQTGETAPRQRARTGPALHPGRTDASIYDVEGIRRRASDMEQVAALYRDNAYRALERADFPGSESRERAQDTVDRLLASRDDEQGTLAHRILVTGNPDYRRAWSKWAARLGTDGLSQAEHAALRSGRALAVGSGADGGYAVPFELDPTVILVSDGAINPLRQLSRVQQITGKEFDLVTSQGVTVSRSNEGTPMPDNTPTLAQPTIRAERVTGFIPFSMEIEQDWQALQSEMMALLADAKDVEEAKSFTLGTGVAPEASGIISTLAASSYVTGAGGIATPVAGDLYALEDAMPPRFRARASWMASKTAFNMYRQLFTQTASAAGDPWVRPSQGTPAELLGYPAYENSEMVTTHAGGDKVIILGDFGRGFIIVDRLGMSTEIAPILFDPATGRPTGQRGLVMFWRNNSRVIADNAFRLLVMASS